MRDVDLIKQKLDMAEVIRSYINLSPAGKNLKGLCPFHQERDASFIVSPDKGIWHCFGCGEGGDLIKFVMMYENLDFPEALRYLAEKAGIEISNISSRDQRQLDVLYNIHEEAKAFFVEQLATNQEAINYLKERGLKEETAKEFEIGFLLPGDYLVVHLLRKKFKLEDIIKAGLAFKDRNGLNKDRFGGRIIFPIINEINKTVAFTGRAFIDQSENVPKYLNSPETPIFKKSKVLFGLYKSKKNIIQSQTALLVEGQMDFLMLWQIGIRNVVAISGTGLTNQHLEKLRRLSDNIVVTFDNDSGGVRALDRALDALSGFDFHMKAVDLGQFGDPAEAAQTNPEFIKKAVEDAKPILEYLLQHYFKTNQPSGMVEIKKAVRHMLHKISNISSSIEQDMWLRELSKYANISEHALRVELDNLSNTKSDIIPEINPQGLSVQERIDLIAKRLLVLCFTRDTFLPIVKTNKHWLPPLYQEVIDNPNSKEAAFIELESSLTIDNGDESKIEQEITELIKQLKIESLKKKQQDLRIKLRAESDGDTEQLVQEMQNTAKEINELKK